MAYSQSFIDEHRYFNTEHGWWEDVYDDFYRVCDILGISVDDGAPSFSGFWSQGDGASWTGSYAGQTYHYADGIKVDDFTFETAVTKIREHAPGDTTLHEIADALCHLNRLYGAVVATVHRRYYGGNYVHSNTMTLHEWEYYYDGDHDKDEIDPVILEHIEETLMAQFKALADWFYDQLETEYDHLTSDEAVVESLEANEIEEETDDEEEEEDDFAMA